MTSRGLRASLRRLWLGRARARDWERVDRALEVSESARDAYRDLVEVERALAAGAPRPTPLQLARTRARLAREFAGHPSATVGIWRWSTRLGLPLAAAAAAVIVVLWTFSGPPDPMSAARQARGGPVEAAFGSRIDTFCLRGGDDHAMAMPSSRCWTDESLQVAYGTTLEAGRVRAWLERAENGETIPAGEGPVRRAVTPVPVGRPVPLAALAPGQWTVRAVFTGTDGVSREVAIPFEIMRSQGQPPSLEAGTDRKNPEPTSRPASGAEPVEAEQALELPPERAEPGPGANRERQP